MINIGIVGCGKWASTIINEINDNKDFNLNSIVCRKKFDNNLNLKIFNSSKKMIQSNIAESIYIAANPNLNLEIVKLSINKKIPLILEKPICRTFNDIKELKKITEKNNLTIIPNLSSYFSETFNELKKIVDKNYENINQVIIYEGGYGPFRENINPIWDWGFHSISLLYLLFEDKEFSNIKKIEIKSDSSNKRGLITKFSFKINNNIKVKIVTGNLFKKKLRKIKIKLHNKNFIVNDLISHELYYNKTKIFKNSKTPIVSLLNTFKNEMEIHKKIVSLKLINASYKTTKFLENFYKC